jgi:hypothetical protein
MITLAGVDELELDEEDEVVELDTDELELRELELDTDELELRELELDRDKLELLLISGADELDKDELDSDEEIDIDDTEDDVSGDELVVEDMDELLTDDEIAIDCDELIADAALLELDEPLPLPEPQATKVQPRMPMIIGFIEEIIIKLSCVIVMVDYTISAWRLYTSNCKELNCAK